MHQVGKLLGDDPEMRYVRGVNFAPSTSVPKFNTFLKLLSADPAHLRWESSTLYSIYGRNSNMGSVCLAHAIISGNEDKRGCTSFFKFIMDHYPFIDHPSITIVSNRDKDLVEFISSVLPNVNSFYCTRHRSGNIAGRFGGEAARAFQTAVKASTPSQLEKWKRDYIFKLPVAARKYMLSVRDELQLLDVVIVNFYFRHSTIYLSYSKILLSVSSFTELSVSDSSSSLL